MTRKGMTAQEYTDFLTQYGYFRINHPTLIQWMKRIGEVRLTLRFCGHANNPELEAVYIGPPGEYGEKEEWITASMHLPLSRDEFFGTFEMKEAAFLRAVIGLRAHVYGNVNIPIPSPAK